MLKKLSLILFALSLNSLLNACATKPPDVPICLELSAVQGWCTYTLSDKEFYIDEDHPYAFYQDQPKMTWWELRPTLLLVPAPSYAALKSYIIKTCKEQNCDSEVGNWQRRVKRIDDKLNSRKD